MRNRIYLAAVLSLVVSGCPFTKRVTGTITDIETNQPIGTCDVTMGLRHRHVNAAGRFRINARKWWEKMDVTCPGYEPQTVTVERSRGRYPVINVEMSRKRRTGHATNRSADESVRPPEME